MAAATKSLIQSYDANATDVKFGVIDAAAVIPAGTLACNDAGVAKALTDTLMQAGATLLGVSTKDYNGADGTSQAMLFLRKTSITLPAGKGGDLPALANVGGKISAQDNQTAKATITGTDASLTYLGRDGSGYRVYLD